MITGDKYGEVTSARRRLIRGTFAAPVVMALHSGSALAVTSNLSCLANGVNRLSQQPAPVVETNDTTYVRVRLHQKGSANKWYLKGADVYSRAFMSVGAKVGVSTAFFPVTGSSWRQVYFPSTSASGPVTLSSPISDPTGTAAGSRWIALRFAPGAQSPVEIIGVVDGTSTEGSAASLNCWSSFAGLAP